MSVADVLYLRRGRLGVSSVEDMGGRRSVWAACLPSGTWIKVSATLCPLGQNLVRRDREVRADLDVVDIGRHPVPPLLVAHVGGELGAQRRRGVGVSGPQPQRLVVAAGDDACCRRG